MGKQQPKDSFLDELDEHDQPTIPLSFAPTAASGDTFILAPQPYERPFPQQGQEIVPAPDLTGRSPGVPVYPLLPPAPAMGGWGRPAGGVVPITPTVAETPIKSHPRRNPLPILVGLFFIAVQMLLLMSFVLKIINLPASATWVGIVYNVSSVFILPFQLLLQNVALPIPIPIAIEIYTMLAILSYWLLSRLLVRLLKAILHSR
jgi:hypothetical protein